jgi:ribosomal protein S12 methylthiotransferase accessory factor
MVYRVHVNVELPPEFPPRYRDAVLRAAAHCTVKQHLEHPPLVEVDATTTAAAGAV